MKSRRKSIDSCCCCPIPPSSIRRPYYAHPTRIESRIPAIAIADLQRERITTGHKGREDIRNSYDKVEAIGAVHLAYTKDTSYIAGDLHSCDPSCSQPDLV